MNIKWTLIAVIVGGLIGGTRATAVPIPVPDDGWHLWPDTKAGWKDDDLYLPDDVDLTRLPTNVPTGGWDALADTTGMRVTLPSTVEQHYWGKFGFRPYTGEEYGYASTDPDVQNGSYAGVSWWWRDLDVPADFAKKVVILRIRGARQRAEVYVNHQLVGYNLIAETSFDCDISKAIKPGEPNQIAIRITNPGGRFDWQDFQTLSWGKYKFQASHGFGGLDRGITLTAHDPVYLAETWVLNTPKVRTVNVHAIVTNETDQPSTGAVAFDVLDPRSGTTVGNSSVTITIPAHASQEVQTPVTDNSADLWTLAAPRLYSLRMTWNGKDSAGAVTTDTDEKRFGFRWFEPRGIGKAAGLYLNDNRIRLYTSISWGFWGLNGLWPTPELAEKEVVSAKQLGLNCLNFHRDIGKEEVLAKQDELGLLRYMEAGGGATTLGATTTQPAPKTVDASGTGGEPVTFGEKYEETKILRMIRQFRSHPSLVIYVIQNEIEPNLSKPRVFNLIRKMQALDPSRVIAAKSGISSAHQVWVAPYDTTVHYDDGTGYSGWRDQHTVGGPGVWTDDLYRDPEHFTHRTADQKEIVDWGEMLGSATPDNHALDIKQILAHGGESYDLKDHQEIDAAYNQFLDHWGFRPAFPTTEKLFADIADKSYEFWGRVIETARLSEGNDILTISGWESTAIENHSGLVDNLRNPKGNPALLQKKMVPLLPVVKPRGLIFRVGEQPTLDLYLLNETNQPVTGRLHLKVTDPSGSETELAAFDAPELVSNQFVYPVKMALPGPALEREGVYRLTFTLDGSTPAENSETVRAVNTSRGDLPPATVGLIGDFSAGAQALKKLKSLNPQIYQQNGKYDLLLLEPKISGLFTTVSADTAIGNTTDPAIFRSYIVGKAGLTHFRFTGLAAGPAEVTLYFADPDSSRAGRRVFDVQVNHNLVLKNFDIFAESGNRSRAIVKTFSVNTDEGSIDIFSPKSSKDESLFNAVRVKSGRKTFAFLSAGEPFTDSTGQLWQPYPWPESISNSHLEQVRAGTPLLVLARDIDTASYVAKRLADAGAFQYLGNVAQVRAAWMGSWIITRHHALFDALPSDEIMKGDYQNSVFGSYGILVEGPSVEIAAAYGRDHDRHIGAALFTASLGRGNIVFSTFANIHPVMQERLLANEIHYLLAKQ